MSLVQKYNAKINTDGTYRQFYGWTVISMVKNDMSILKNYLCSNPILKEYFSPLCVSSYHITIYNIWSNGVKLLPAQKKNLLGNDIPKLEELSLEGYFNLNNCIDELLYKLYYKVSKVKWSSIELTVEKVYFTRGTIGISFILSNEMVKMNEIREILTNTCEKEDGMGMYHMTLGYVFKDMSEDLERIQKEVSIFSTILMGQKITIENPQVCSFDNMMSFHPL